MALVNAYRDFLAAASIGEAVTPFNNANAHLGVGNGTTAVAATQTDLQGASKARKAMDVGYPTRSTNVMTFRSTFGTADANFSWDEFGEFSASTGGVMMSRVVQDLGEKSSAETKQVTVTVTLGLGA